MPFNIYHLPTQYALKHHHITTLPTRAPTCLLAKYSINTHSQPHFAKYHTPQRKLSDNANLTLTIPFHLPLPTDNITNTAPSITPPHVQATPLTSRSKKLLRYFIHTHTFYSPLIPLLPHLFTLSSNIALSGNTTNLSAASTTITQHGAKRRKETPRT